IEQRRDRRRPGLVVAEHGGLALAVERQRLQHFQHRRRRFRIAPGPDRAAEEIERQHLGALQYLRRDVVEFEIGDIACERFGFMRHGVASCVLELRDFGTAATACRQHHFLRVRPLDSMRQIRRSMRSWPKNVSFSNTKVGTPQWPEAAWSFSLPDITASTLSGSAPIAWSIAARLKPAAAVARARWSPWFQRSTVPSHSTGAIA